MCRQKKTKLKMKTGYLPKKRRYPSIRVKPYRGPYSYYSALVSSLYSSSKRLLTSKNMQMTALSSDFHFSSGSSYLQTYSDSVAVEFVSGEQEA